MSRSPTWRYHAAKRRQKLRDFATMYGASLVVTDKIIHTHADYSAIEERILAHMGEDFTAILGELVADGKISANDVRRLRNAIDMKELYIVPVSRDRVRFNLQPYGSDQPTRDAFYKAFGAPFPSRPMGDTVIVICRPSQFARFMIYRNDFGGKNSFKELNPVLFTPDAQKHEIDVSGNPAS